MEILAIDIAIVLAVFTVSAIPFLIFGSAEVLTGIYRKRILRRRISHISELPRLVRIHGMIVRKLSMCLLVNIGSVLIFFGFPIFMVGILWPQELVSFLASLQFWFVLWSVLVLIRIGCNSPDPTGGLGEAFELLETDEHTSVSS